MMNIDYNAVDFVALAIVVWEIVMGWRRRMAGELFRMLCSLFVLFAAWKYYHAFGTTLAEHTRLGDNPDMAMAIAFAMLTIMLGTACALLHLILGLLVKVEFHAGINRAGGAVMGLLRGVLVVVLLIYAAGLWPHAMLREVFLQQSLSGRAVTRTAPPVIRFLRAVNLDFRTVPESRVDDVPARN